MSIAHYPTTPPRDIADIYAHYYATHPEQRPPQKTHQDRKSGRSRQERQAVAALKQACRACDNTAEVMTSGYHQSCEIKQ